jgi:hypothetical protein
MRVKGVGFVVAVSTLSLILGVAATPAFAEEGTRQAATANTTEVALTSSEPMVGPALLPGVEIKCGKVTCSRYYSKRETVEAQKQFGTAAANRICALIGAKKGENSGKFRAICTAAVSSHSERIKRNLTEAVNRRGCFVVRHNSLKAIRLGTAPFAVSFGNVAGNHKLCKP